MLWYLTFFLLLQAIPRLSSYDAIALAMTKKTSKASRSIVAVWSRNS